MSYHVLARKWRPHTFEAMVGQEHVLRMLMNALDHQRLHHAYLFTGTRGVGKTTLARLLAKCLNCEVGISAKPCDQCSACQAIDAGRFLDLIEVDAASRTKVEDTRELLDNVQYAPTQGRFKIYLIDEVHMLSGHSFNALLKTLEEPPAHVKFLLATTDPKRLPITILSRCLQFNLKRVPEERIAAQLQYICTAENVAFESSALQLLASAADGSMRDALSLLDQTIAYCSDKITTADTRTMLGSIEQDVIFRLLDALANHDGKRLLAEIAQLAEFAPDFGHVLADMLSLLHQISVLQVVPDAVPAHEQIKQLALQLTPEEVQLYYQIALIGRRDLTLAPHPHHGFEMVMLRMLAFKPVMTTDSTPDKKPETQHSPVQPQLTKPHTERLTPSPLVSQPTSSHWADILPRLDLSGMAYALASNCTLDSLTEHTVKLTLSAQHEPMLNPKLSERIEQALCRYLNKPIQLSIQVTKAQQLNTPLKQQQETQALRQASATDAIKNDTHVLKIMDMFGATVDMDSVKALDGDR